MRAAASRFPRASGILLHPTSLPARHGIGDVGDGAERFVDFLAAAGQHYWLMLPVNAVGFGDSPYAGSSAFAGNPLLISLDRLAAQGLLSQETVETPLPQGEVDFPAVRAFKRRALDEAVDAYRKHATHSQRERFEGFRAEQAGWLSDYALYKCLHDAAEGRPWPEWPRSLAMREADAVVEARQRFAAAIEAEELIQFWFSEQWSDMHRYARERGVRLVGDVPIFVALDSADVWAHRDLFLLDEDGRPSVVSGVPPDVWSATGQLWGNPLYDWDALAASGYGWWVERFRSTLTIFDAVRVDHFRGFCACWAVPAEHTTAEHGEWMPVPGEELFAAARQQLGDLPLIVEDLGLITRDVEELRDRLGYPGMKVLHFAFDSDADNPFLPHNYHPNFVVYTGTHDNDTTRGWWEKVDGAAATYMRRYTRSDGSDVVWDLIRLAMASVADLAVAPLQDVLDLGSEARMNTPAVLGGNWAWRFLPGQLTQAHADRLRELAETYGRLGADD